MNKTEKCADFVTWRGIITRIICTPFKANDSWSFNVMRRDVRAKRHNYIVFIFRIVFLLKMIKVPN